MERTGWEHYDLQKEMSGASVARLLGMYKREKKKALDACGEFLKLTGSLTDDGAKEYEDKCKLLVEGTKLIAERLADKLTEDE
ncbi:hypothetical protein TROLL_196 [Bacillus phage Troll]|uniref:Uncharacterized protein n=6 Tax=Caudoviricetes TaxID=2731619 RepID=A0A075M0D1_9CAUD|nr:hypothetical protein TROLL_196 [Bacillus phage Troll]YP_009055953.1 hypothetical protein LD11_gp188 [Bacillus phage Riley]YP_009206548.1 hypothetical protein AVV02_gp193 [Bacillus phage AvesoBmore]YP_009290066.1 transposase [Bacillus phage Phrodo]AMW61718.1 transposase [Bacillus phage Juglone]ASZ75921.1 hypothetical protein TAFFO16_188 [Bacillus phage Taffo16]QDH49886.1 hypothetical protein BEYONPHE_199 [Bacillus phage Beyonphe]UGO48999.1 hypothetical protein JARJAR_185 [Bacillus phage vB